MILTLTWPDQDQKERDLMIFDLVKRRYDSEWQRINNLDSKANNLIGFISVIVTLLLGAGTLQVQQFLSNSNKWLFVTGIGFLVASLCASLWAFKVRRWKIVPHVDTLVPWEGDPNLETSGQGLAGTLAGRTKRSRPRIDYTQYTYRDLLQKNAGQMSKAVLNAEKKNDHKAKCIQISWGLLITGLIFSSVFVALFIYGAR